MATAPAYASTPRITATQFVPADTTSAKTIFTPGSNGSRVHQIWVSTDESAEKKIRLYITISGTDYAVDVVTLPVATAALPIVIQNLMAASRLTFLDPIDVALILPNGATLKASMEASITNAKIVNVFVAGGDF